MSEPFTVEELKRRAAEYAVERFVRDGMVVGLGTGSTARYALEAIARRLRTGVWRNVRGVPTSRATAELARALGIPLTTLEECPVVDVTVDGADEVDPHMNLIKGLGGALLWEKIVAVASQREVIIVDERKRVPRLGTRSPLPVEVVPFGWSRTLRFLEALGGEPRLRVEAHGRQEQPVITDGGHYIVDCHFPGGIPDPEGLAARLCAWPGVVEHGLFLNLATDVVVATSQGIEVMQRDTGETGAVHSVG